VLIILLELIRTRVDVIPVYLLGIILSLVNTNSYLDQLGRCVEKPLCCCFIKYECFMKSNQEILKEKPLQHVVTSNSVVFEDV